MVEIMSKCRIAVLCHDKRTVLGKGETLCFKAKCSLQPMGTGRDFKL